MKKVGIIGAGTMGQGIILNGAIAGCDVFVYETYEKSIQRARSNFSNILNKEVEKSRLTEAQAHSIQSRINFAKNIQELYSCDIVIEAIVEDAQIKWELFKQLSDTVSDQCILASNTSSLSISSLASAVSNPERFIGIHFFNPAHIMKLVEVIPAIQTSKQVTEKVIQFIRQCNKLPVVAKDTPGFIVNRIARPYYGEAIKIYEEGIAEPVDIDWAMTEAGFKMGPFTLMDFIGHDINYNVTEIVYNAFYQDPRYRPSFSQKRLVEAGFLGVKTKRGFYSYNEKEEKPKPTIDSTLSHQISRRIIIMLINEAADAVFYNVASIEDIETSMTKGVNYPKGLLTWADEIGIKECVRQLDELFDYYRDPRYRCSPLLRNMSKENKTFFTT